MPYAQPATCYAKHISAAFFIVTDTLFSLIFTYFTLCFRWCSALLILSDIATTRYMLSLMSIFRYANLTIIIAHVHFFDDIAFSPCHYYARCYYASLIDAAPFMPVRRAAVYRDYAERHASARRDKFVSAAIIRRCRCRRFFAVLLAAAAAGAFATALLPLPPAPPLRQLAAAAILLLACAATPFRWSDDYYDTQSFSTLVAIVRCPLPPLISRQLRCLSCRHCFRWH